MKKTVGKKPEMKFEKQPVLQEELQREFDYALAYSVFGEPPKRSFGASDARILEPLARNKRATPKGCPRTSILI